MNNHLNPKKNENGVHSIKSNQSNFQIFFYFSLLYFDIEFRTQPDEQDFKQDAQEKSSSIVDTVTSKQESTTKEIPASTDSLVNIVEQIKTVDTKPQQQQSDDMTEKQPASINFLTEIVSQVNSQRLTSSSEEQQIITDTKKSSQPSKPEDKLSSVDLSVESTQPISKSEEQPISRTSTTIERTISTDRQPSLELQSTPETDEQEPSDSLVNIVRQIHASPQIARLPSTDEKTETSQSVEQTLEEPPVDISVEKEQTSESIPIKPEQVADTKDVLPKSDEITIITETTQETTSKETTKEDEAERLTTAALTNAMREILATSRTSQVPADNVITKTTEKSSTDFIDESAATENVDQDVR